MADTRTSADPAAQTKAARTAYLRGQAEALEHLVAMMEPYRRDGGEDVAAVIARMPEPLRDDAWDLLSQLAPAILASSRGQA